MPPLKVQPIDLVRAVPALHLPDVEDALRALADRGVLATAGNGYAWGPRAAELEASGSARAPARKLAQTSTRS